MTAGRRARFAIQPSQIVLRVEAAGEGREVPKSVGRHHAGVFDTDAAKTQLVETRLDRDDVAFPKRVVGCLAQRRLLMHVKTNAVSRAVVHLGDTVRTLV